MRIVLLGPPGSGKAELSKKIADAYSIPIITQAGIVDTVAAEPGELGRLAADARDASRVSDELLLALLRIQLPKMDLSKGFLLVDMPRDSGQADVLDELLNELAKPVDLVLKLDVDMDELMERLVGRIQCDHCGAEYNLYVNPPMVDGVCDECGGRVRRRPHDYEETISNRLRVYEGQMGPLLQYYQQAEKLHRFDATGNIAPLWTKVKALIDATPSQVVEPASSPAAVGEGGAPGREVKGSKSKKRPVKATKKTAKKAVTKKAPSKKATSKKATSKKATSKKAASKKVVSKKAATKKAAAKKAVSRKAAAKKGSAKKVAAKKTVTKKAAKKVVAKKAPAAKKVAAQKASKKKVVKKLAAKKVVKKVAKKAPAKKVVGKKVTKKTTRAAASKKSVTKKAPARKVAKKTAAKPAKKKVAKKAVRKSGRK